MVLQLQGWLLAVRARLPSSSAAPCLRFIGLLRCGGPSRHAGEWVPADSHLQISKELLGG